MGFSEARPKIKQKSRKMGLGPSRGASWATSAPQVGPRRRALTAPCAQNGGFGAQVITPTLDYETHWVAKGSPNLHF